jgi:hypothetical protein
MKKKVNNKKLFRFLIIFSSLFILGLFLLISIQPAKGLLKPLYSIIILWPNIDSGKPNLQLYTFPYITIPPPPTTNPSFPPNPNMPQNPPNVPPNSGPQCAPNGAVPSEGCKCEHPLSWACPKPPACIQGGPDAQNEMPLPGASGPNYCWNIAYPPAPAGRNDCIAYCLAKPVIYLYPTQTTDVSVSVVSPGSVVVSDPHYPEGGWEHVLAHPDGTLLYNNKKYSELFYETSLNQNIPEPKKGIIIAYKDIKTVLRKTTTQFGLNALEQKEFLDYWVPRLQSLHHPYIFFSILDPEVKEPIDKLVISPEPVTRIELIAYFKPLQTPIQVTPLSLPDQPSSRVGFTEVEWGGTIAY